MPAARIGPTVCELDGPMPILKRSKALMVTVRPPAAGRLITDLGHENRDKSDVIMTKSRDKSDALG
jgi:hypothetical protein